MTANERPNLMTRSLLEVFNQRDRLDRAEAISQIYSIDVVFYEYDDTFAGRAALHERVQQLLDDSPSFVFTPVGGSTMTHDLGRQPWAFGPPNGPAVVFGTDIARVVGERIEALYVFVDPPAA